MVAKRIIACAVLAVSACWVYAQQQSPQMVQFLKEFPQRAGFNTHAYEFIPIQDTKAPKGYQPFYISHYGRHGARSEWGDFAFKQIVDVLTQAKAEGVALTSAGDSLLNEATYLRAQYNGMDGRLTPRGVREHQQLARRMYNRFPEVFKKGSGQIRAVSSTQPRCLVSMNGFTAELRAIQPSLDIDLDTGEKYMAYIAKAADRPLKEKVQKALDERKYNVLPDTVSVFGNLFKDPEAGKKYVKNNYFFHYSIYAIAKVAEAFDVNDNLFRYLPFADVYQLHESTFMNVYLCEGNSALFGDERMPLSKDLADVLFAQAEAVISGQSKRAADLTFGHDWPFVGLCAYLGLEGIGDRLTIDEAAASWLPSWNCPFAANLQMIFYRSAKNPDVLVKFLVNERETAIPAIQPVEGPYYRWDDVKKYVHSRF